MEPDLDLHADSEGWESNRDDAVCEACGGPRVVYIPAWADGSGVLTPEEVGEILGRARLRVLEDWERTASRGLEPMDGTLPEDIVMRIDGRLDGTFRAVIIANGGNERQAYTRYGRGSSYTGAFGWRHGLATSRHTHQATTEEERAEGLIAYEGEPGILNFSRRNLESSLSPEAKEARKERRKMRDRTSKNTSWERHMAAAPRPAAEDGEPEQSQAAE